GAAAVRDGRRLDSPRHGYAAGRANGQSSGWHRNSPGRVREQSAMPVTSRVPAQVDVLRWPVIGSVLRWRHVRTSAQLVLLIAAAVVVLHGLLGPQISPNNLATVLTWVHYRGLLIGALLAVGN